MMAWAESSRNASVLRLGPDGPRRRSDPVAVEEPLEVRVNGERLMVTMRTPGDDIDLVHGLLHSEGVITDVEDVTLARYCAGSGPDGVNTYNVLDVSLAAGVAPPPADARRQVVTTSACGICGTTSIDQVLRQSRFPLPPTSACRPPWSGPARNGCGSSSGSSPGPAGCTPRACSAATAACTASGRTSVGTTPWTRWSAGRSGSGGSRWRDTLLVVSGRASYELTQKAVLAGIGMLVAVSAPSSLAVDLAAEAGLTLVGFVRGESMNVYTHPDRIVPDPPARGVPATIAPAMTRAEASDGYGP